MMKLKFVTTNKHKFAEVRKILPVEIEFSPLNPPEVQADSLEEVVDFELDYLTERGYDNFFLEDSGLFIDSLKGFPGVYSSFVYKTIGCEGILKIMEDIATRSARFECCIGAVIRGKRYKIKGICAGKITSEMMGEGGFGFDPIFVPEGYDRTFAEMTTEEKNEISHRGRAFKKFRDLLLTIREDL